MWNGFCLDLFGFEDDDGTCEWVLHTQSIGFFSYLSCSTKRIFFTMCVYICMMYGLYFKHNLNINIQKKVLCMYILTSSSHHPQLFLTGMFQAARFIEILFSQLSVEILNG